MVFGVDCGMIVCRVLIEFFSFVVVGLVFGFFGVFVFGKVF